MTGKYYTLPSSSQKNMELEKVIDENRQGEALLVPGQEGQRKLFLESYGCQMNFSDSEIVASILGQDGFATTKDYREADVIFINTCAIRENAEQRVRNRLNEFKSWKSHKPDLIVGVLGCMAERLKEKFLEEEKIVDIVVGPDAYRDLPQLIGKVQGGHKAVNVILSKEETYADITPVRLDSNGVTAFISIMRGCDNMCSFCVVPFTRGRERSRDPESIVKEAKELFDMGYREVTLLGQNVDSYLYAGGGLKKEILTEEQRAQAVNFAQLLERVALVSPELRIRFSTSHPKDMTDEVLHTMAKYDNICKYIHLPLQSGSTRVLQLMNRTYTKEWYMAKVDRIRTILPDCGITADIIAGFCTEQEEDHQETLRVMEYSGFDFSYMFFYSERPGTLAARRYQDDVPETIKKRRLQEIVEKQNQLSLQSNQRDLGKVFTVLIEGDSKKNNKEWKGRSSQNKVIVFPKSTTLSINKGSYVQVRVTECTQATLRGVLVS